MNPHADAEGSGTRPEGRAPVAVALKSPLGKKKKAHFSCDFVFSLSHLMKFDDL